MVEKDGEKKTRLSKSRRPRGLPKSYRLQKRIPESNPSGNKLRKLNCNLNCTEKLSSLLMCQKGYASFAFYAVFTVFILAFIYVLWKIVSANTSRSGQGRRPEPSPKVSPTASSPTWSEEDEEELKKFFPTSVSFTPTNIETEKKTEPTVIPSNFLDPNKIMRKNNYQDRELPTPTPQSPQTNFPSLRLLRGSVFGEDTEAPLYGRNRQSAIIGEDFTPFLVTSPFQSNWPPLSNVNWKIKQQQQQQQAKPWAFSFNRQQQMPLAYQKRNPQLSFLRNSEFPGQHYVERGRNSLQSGNEGYKESMRSNFYNKKRMTTSLSHNEEQDSVKKEKDKSSNRKNKEKRRHHMSYARKHHRHNSDGEDSKFHQKVEQYHNARDTISRPDKVGDDRQETRNNHKHHKSWLRNHHKKHVGGHRGEKMEDTFKDVENVDYSDQSDDSNKETNHRHHYQVQQHLKHQNQHLKHQHHQPHQQHHHTHQHHTHQHPHHQKHHHHNDLHHYPKHHHHHHRKKYPSKNHFHHEEHPDEENLETHHKTKRIHRHSSRQTKHTKRTNHIHHLKHHHAKTERTSDHFAKHHRFKEKHKSSKNTMHSKNSIPTKKDPVLKHLHHVLDYQHYIRFKQSHSLDEEVQGKWKGLRRKIKDCINIRTFTANGKVRLSRTRYHSKYLYTVLVCNVVKVIKRGRRQNEKTKYKTTQLCHKLYFVTKAIIKVKSEKRSLVAEKLNPEFKVDACKPSKEIHFEAVSFKGIFTEKHSLRSHRSEIPKHDHKGSYNRKKHKKKKGDKHRRKKGNKQHRIRKHERKMSKHRDKVTRSKKSKHLHHLKKSSKSMLKTKKRLSKKQDKKRKKEKNDKSEDGFFGKLLKVLTIASGKNTTANASTSPLLQLKGTLQKMKKAKEEKAQQLKERRNKKHKKESKNHITKENRLPDVSSPKYIQKLLEKILPSVVNNVKADLQGSKGKRTENDVKDKEIKTTTSLPTTATPPTTLSTPTTMSTPTTKATTTTTITTQTTPSTTKRPKTKPTTKSKGLEDELKDILPLLLKKAQLAKITTTQKPTTIPTTKPTTLSKSKEIKQLLARLKLGGFDLGGLGNSKPTRDVRTTVNAVHTTVQQKLEALSEPDSQLLLPSASSMSPQTHKFYFPRNNVESMNQIPNMGGPVSVLGNDPFSKNILCFGDSLTNGYFNHGRGSHPYSIQLSHLLNANSQIRYKLVTSGKTGEMTHGSMTKRLPEVLGNNSHFDWVIILAGTNDVAHVKNFGDDDSFMNQLVSVWSPKIFKDIITLHESAYKYGARTVLLTIPESAYESWPQFRTLWFMRKKINQELREFARRSQGKTVLCDLALKIPRHSLSPQMQKVLWSDHLHLTPYGYNKMAEVIYQCIKPYL